MSICPACHSPNCDGYCMANMTAEPGNLRKIEGEWEPPGVEVYPIQPARSNSWAWPPAIAIAIIFTALAYGVYLHMEPQPSPAPTETVQRVEMFLFCYNDATKAWDRCRQGLKNADGKISPVVSMMVQGPLEYVCDQKGRVTNAPNK